MTATSFSALAHEVRPAYLQITEGSDQHYQILWKQPVMGEMAVHLAPQLSSGWLKEKPASVETTASLAIKTWNDNRQLHLTLVGLVPGLEQFFPVPSPK